MKKIGLLTTLLVAGLLLTGCNKLNSEIDEIRTLELAKTQEGRIELCNNKILAEIDSGATNFVGEEIIYSEGDEEDWHVDNFIYFIGSNGEDRVYGCGLGQHGKFIKLFPIDQEFLNSEEYQQLEQLREMLTEEDKDEPVVEEPEEDIPEGGERITVVTDMCEGEGGSIEELYEWTDKQNVCYFSDDSFCYLDDFAADSCHKGDNKREESNYKYPQDLNGKPLEEAFCSYNDGIIITNEYGDNFCVFEDGGYYELKAFKELGKMPALRGQDEPFCSDHENVVCGVDGVSYVNECWMKSTGMGKDPNAKFVDGKCVKK